MATSNDGSSTRFGKSSQLEPLGEDAITETETFIGDPPPLPTADKVIRTNHLHISKRGFPVEGQYILDLSLPPPPSRSGWGSISKNICLHSTYGSITAEIWIVHDGSEQSKQVCLDLCSDDGAVNAKVHDPYLPDGNGSARPPLDIDLRANYGVITLWLPRCFRGPMTIHTNHENIVFSPALEKCTALFSDVQGTREYFLGDRPRRGKWSMTNAYDWLETTATAEEPVDTLRISGRHSGVRIKWIGEEEPTLLRSVWNGVGRLFTFS